MFLKLGAKTGSPATGRRDYTHGVRRWNRSGRFAVHGDRLATSSRLVARRTGRELNWARWRSLRFIAVRAAASFTGPKPPDGHRQSREGHGGLEVDLVESFHDGLDVGFEILQKAAFQAAPPA